MKLKNMKKEELEIMSYTDLTEMILKEEKKSLTTPDIFKKICELLEYSDDQFSEKIGDFYTSLTLDKRFAFLDNNKWDLREKHAVVLSIDEDEEEIIDEVEEELEEEIIDEEVDDLNDDMVEDLTIVTEDELDED